MKIIEREIPDATVQTLVQSGINPLLARLYVARGVQSMDELDTGLGKLLPPSGLRGIQEAACVLADAIAQQRRICIVADYDCDGATACAVGVRGLRMLGAQHVTYEVPDRINDGYGLSAPIARRVHAKGHELLLTVDNGIGSVEGVAEAMRLGLTVVVTDHHLPGETLPTPHAMVNPNQPGCTFASKHLAGVGVMFYVLLVLRAELRTRGVFNAQNQPKLDTLLPLVALGTVADVVKLDANNRRLVAQGLQRIRKGHMQAGIRGLYEAAGKTYAQATTSDFGFALGPRINAAGRLADMTIGIECLLTDDDSRALELAHVLTRINRDRQEMESGMRMQAFALADELWEDGSTPPAAISVFDPDFHEGVVGIVASRVKDRLHRPTFVFAASQAEGKAHELKGSGRSIPGFHLRDALDLVAKRHPGVLLRFGGHAMAAGCTLVEDQFHTFERAFAQVAQEWLDAKTLTRCVETDGPLDPAFRQADVVERLNLEVWGQGFAAPTFSEDVEVISQRLVAEKHLKLQLRHRGDVVDGIWFGRTAPLPDWVHMAFRLDINEFRGERKVQFLVEGTEG
ncbi:single-stranded-DNA-specific exonuclease RecJ [Comamonas jiangduensis]|jgi:single-stranded-DNA-specific exonuclease|uniref:single-stranded-DNA-specific exonuclease RecJ n=1 Tax=Comamonas jiangduensis TaxID=1194168 RepID=UPI0028A9D31B|nr:single-stranded-DNA-specific exonuclease RecJ [Comamonas jiangduensis]